MDTRILKHGVPARLFPVVPESSKEQKSLSIFLANLISVRPFAERIMSPLGVKLGKRSSLDCFTEVTLTNEIKGLKDRPDALIVIESGKKSWSALVEAKIGKNIVEPDQLERYVELAKLNNIDAIITISNQLTPAPDINPTQISKSVPKKLELFHLSWASILTTAFLLAAEKEDPYNNDDEAYLISEFIRYLEHSSSGMARLDQMSREWPKIVSDVQAGHPLNAKADGLTEMVVIWLQESRDVALLMTRTLKEPVSIATSRNNLNNPGLWIENELKSFICDKLLSFELQIPNAASRVRVESDFLRRSIRVSMKILAPTDRKSNGAKLNWLLKQLSKSEKEKVIIRCITKGKAQNFGAMADEIDPKSDEINSLSDVNSFELEMSADLGAKFNSRKKFVENLEAIVPEFYRNVGQHIREFVPPPPPVTQKANMAVPSEEVEGSLQNENAEKPTPAESRPSWAIQWRAADGTETTN